MLTTTQNINSLEWSEKKKTGFRKTKLSIEFASSEMTIYINNGYKPPISWFLTDTLGEMIEMGQIADTDYRIDLRQLPIGTYALRIAGEVHIIHNNTLIASQS